MQTVSEIRMTGLVMRPAGATMQGPLITIQGQLYAVAPALYKVVATGQQHVSILGNTEQLNAAANLTPEYLPPEQWPAGLALDNAITCDSTDVAQIG
jgi:hypothetical protein